MTTRIVITLVITIVFVASATTFFVNFSGPADVATQAMQVAIVSGLVHLIWLPFAAGKDCSTDSDLAIDENMKQTYLWLLLCIPGAFLIVGLLAAPVIVAISSIRLLVVLWKEQLANQ